MNFVRFLSKLILFAKKYSTAILSIFVVLLVCVIVKDCNQPTPSTDVVLEQKAIDDTFALKEKAYKETIKAMTERADYYEKVAAEKTKRIKVLESSLKNQSDRVDLLAAGVKEAAKLKDSLAHFEKCDSLAEEVPVLTALIDDYRDQIDSLNADHRKLINHKDSAISLSQGFNSDMRNALMSTKDLNEKITDENKMLKKKLKRNKLLTKAVAIGGVIAAGILLTK